MSAQPVLVYFVMTINNFYLQWFVCTVLKVMLNMRQLKISIIIFIGSFLVLYTGWVRTHAYVINCRTSDSPATSRFPCCSKENNLLKNVYQISFALKMHGQNLNMNILLQSRVADPGFMVGAGFVFWKGWGRETALTFWIKISWNRFFLF